MFKDFPTRRLTEQEFWALIGLPKEGETTCKNQ